MTDDQMEMEQHLSDVCENCEALCSVKNTAGLAEQDIQKLLEQLEEKGRLLEDAVSKYKRLQADFENFRRRVNKEKEDISGFATERIILELLPVIDNFERALSSSKENAASLAAGVEMIFRQFNSTFAKIGVEPIAALDSQFDPNLHEAVQLVEDSGKPEGTIIFEMLKGYTLNGRTLRASVVRVAGN